MIAYFDSSSIVKWFFDEPFMELARKVREEAEVCVTSLISLPEVMSGANRARKEGRCSRGEMETVRSEFLRVWPNFQWIDLNEDLMRQGSELVFKHNLRAFDAIHLASALVLKQEGSKLNIFFSCFDKTLNRAASKEGFIVHETHL